MNDVAESRCPQSVRLEHKRTAQVTGLSMFDPLLPGGVERPLRELQPVLSLAAQACGCRTLHLFLAAGDGALFEAHGANACGECGDATDAPPASEADVVRAACLFEQGTAPLPPGTQLLPLSPRMRAVLWEPSGRGVPPQVVACVREAVVRTVQKNQLLTRLNVERVRLRDFARASGDWLWETDASHVCNWISPNFEACTGYPATQVVGHAVRPHPELDWFGDPVAPARTFAECLATREPISVVCAMGRTQRRRVISIRAVPRYLAGGAFAGYRGVCRDVTDRVRLERDAREKAAAEQANRAKSEFLSKVSHELRTPLNAILGLSELLQERRVVPADSEAAGWIKIIGSSGQYLLGMVNGLLELGRIEQGKLSLTMEDVSVRDAVGFALLIVGGDGRCGLQVRERHAVDQPVVRADRLAFEQILVNLLTNAQKYNRPGGSIEIWTEQRGDDMVVGITDTGIGIAPERRGDLFKPFHRLGAEQTGVQGSGLGLSICKALAVAMGGRLDIDSAPGVGTTCSLTLAAGAPAPQRDRHTPAASVYDLEDIEPKHVLYIEDDPVNALLASQAIQAIPGWQVSVADCASDGVRLAGMHHPDIVLIDMNLPDGTGFEVLDRLRALDVMRQVPCVALSADCMPQQVADALKHGFQGYWTKPIAVAELRRRLIRLAGARAPATCTD